MRLAIRQTASKLTPVGLTTLTVFVVVYSMAACSLMTAPLPPNAERFTPPAVFSRWWAMTEACSGRSGDLRAVSWYRVPRAQIALGDQSVAGYWSRNANRIVLAEPFIDDGATVRHEMLHALLQTGKHPRSQFLGACASLVGGGGTTEPWRAPRIDYVILPPESLEVGSHAELLPPESDGQRWLALEVSVRNPRSSAVVVAAPGDPVTPPTFGYDLRGPSGGISGGEVATDSSSLFFQPFETKKWLLEFRVASDLSEYHVSPGSYLVRGGYARRWSAYETIGVSP